MKYYAVSLFLIQRAAANINFHWVQPTCDSSTTDYNNCLKGQYCTENGTCDPTPRAVIAKRDFSSDGHCGPENGNATCDPNSHVYFGTCCSFYGWCGNSESHCGTGCISGCHQISSSSPAAAPSSALGEPTIGQSIASQMAEPTQNVTSDGTCGAHNDGTICGNWPKGSCCSMYGFCGNTTAHCGDGCQSGPCTNGASNEAPGPSAAPANTNPGSFNIVGQSGVPPMHGALLENGRVVFLDKVENYTQLGLPNGEYAYSCEFDPRTAACVPLSYSTNAFCSGGSYLSDGRLINVGGNAPLSFLDPTVGDGFTAIRYLRRSANDIALDGQSWIEPGNKLNSARWYASVQTLADGRVFVASGSLNGLDPAVPANNNPTYEFLDTQGASTGKSIPLDILEKNQPYYMYPFIHLLRDGKLFIFVAKSADLFDTASQTTTKQFPDLPGLFRTYPNTGGSVLLPLSSNNNWGPDVIVCGGGAYQDITSPADASCGRIQPLSANPQWEMDSMPEDRVMVEGTLLPDGTVIWLNGCSQGAQGFGLGQDPAFEALIYSPSKPLGQRFTVGATTNIARLYHSVALLLLDGTLLIAGSNPVEQPVLQPSDRNPYVTEFRVEIYTPPYLSGNNANRRPAAISISTKSLTANGSNFTIRFQAPDNAVNSQVVLYHGGFITHSVHMGHRMAFLDTGGWIPGAKQQVITATMPPNANIAPPGPYVIYVLVDGVPGIGQTVMVG